MTPSQVHVPQQTSAARDSQPHIHPPKIELFDLDTMTNTDPKGFVRTVEEYRLEPFGLYMARRIVEHPRVEYVESWLLPQHGLRISDWWFHPGVERDQDFYLDIADVTPGEKTWRTVDHYLDVLVRTGRDARVLDSDELLAAVLHGLLDASVAEGALETAYRVVDGLARADYQLDRWLATQGITLSWRRHK